MPFAIVIYLTVITCDIQEANQVLTVVQEACRRLRGVAGLADAIDYPPRAREREESVAFSQPVVAPGMD